MPYVQQRGLYVPDYYRQPNHVWTPGIGTHVPELPNVGRLPNQLPTEITYQCAITPQGTPLLQSFNTSAGAFTRNNVVVASGTDTIMVVVACMEGQADGAGSISDITYNSDALTKLIGVSPANWSRAEIWYRLLPDVTTASVVITWSGLNCKAVVAVYVIDGVNQSTPWRTPASSSNSTGTSVSDTVTGVIGGDYIIDGLCIDGTGHSAVVGADQTQRMNQTSTSGNTGCSSVQDGSSGGVMSWTWTTSASYSHVAGALIPSGNVFVPLVGGPGGAAGMPLAGVGGGLAA